MGIEGKFGKRGVLSDVPFLDRFSKFENSFHFDEEFEGSFWHVITFNWLGPAISRTILVFLLILISREAERLFKS
jgi:hypothetical protein